MRNPIRTLIIEDSPEDAKLLVNELQRGGCEVLSERVQSAGSLRTALAEQEWDLILCDYTMPDFSGLEALAIVKAAGLDVPFIYVSGTIGEEKAVETMRAGAQDYVMKDRMNRLAPAVQREMREAEERRERRRAQARIQEQAALLDLVPEAVIVRDREGIIRFWNHGAERLYGWTKAEAVDRPAEELFYQTDSQGTVEARSQTLLNGAWTGEMPQVTKNGQPILVQSHWTLMRATADSPPSFLVVNTDVTQKKRAEAELMRVQRLESIGRLAGGITHDLNNILGAMMMAIPVLQEEALSENAQSMLATLDVSVQRGASIVKQVLTFARGISGEKVDLQMRHLVREMANMIKETFPKNICLRTHVADDLWPVIGDTTQLHQVLLNLCVNARDAMPAGGMLTLSAQNVELDETFVQVAPGARPGPYVLLEVMDTGEGIPPAIIDRIFEPFFTTKAPDQGTGLGLATVLGILQNHGGFIRVISKEGLGAQFKVYLPAHPDSVLLPPDSARPALPQGQGELILLIDDEISIQQTIKSALTQHGYAVVTANDGPEALAIVARCYKQIKAVVTDMMMPIMDGVATIRALRSMRPNLKIIAIGGLGDETQTSQVAALGVPVFLRKPFSHDLLLKALHDLLQPARTMITPPPNHPARELAPIAVPAL